MDKLRNSILKCNKILKQVFKREMLSEDKIIIAIVCKYIFEFPVSKDKKTMMDDEVFAFDKRKHVVFPGDNFSGTKT